MVYFRKAYLKVTSHRSAPRSQRSIATKKGFWMMPAATLNVIAYNKKMVASARRAEKFF